MKQTRSIRLFFILAAVGLVVFFWLGFRFGRQIQQSENRIEMSRQQPEKEQSRSTKDTDAGRDLPAAETMKEKSAEGKIDQGSSQQEKTSGENDNSREETEAQVPKFYLKQSGEYLVVYVSATNQVYFETDIPAADLPTDLKEDVKAGIDFYNLEHLYSFLENYAS